VISKEERHMLNYEMVLIDLYEKYMRAIYSHKESLGLILFYLRQVGNE
jgi:hypothetical protein